MDLGCPAGLRQRFAANQLEGEVQPFRSLDGVGDAVDAGGLQTCEANPLHGREGTDMGFQGEFQGPVVRVRDGRVSSSTQQPGGDDRPNTARLDISTKRVTPALRALRINLTPPCRFARQSPGKPSPPRYRPKRARRRTLKRSRLPVSPAGYRTVKANPSLRRYPNPRADFACRRLCAACQQPPQSRRQSPKPLVVRLTGAGSAHPFTMSTTRSPTLSKRTVNTCSATADGRRTSCCLG